MGTWTSGSWPPTLDGLVRRQMALSPEAAAVAWEGGSWSYGELAARASGVAARLRRAGVRRGDRVGVCVARSPEMVAALLGVLEAGAAWVPLDPEYPVERLRWMQQDASPSALLVAQAGLPAGLEAGGVPLVDASGAEAEAAAGGGAGSATGGGDLAYVLYTSGSTGRPKGVMVPHRAIVNRLLWMQETWPLAAGDRVLQKTPFGFDASVWEVFVPLLSGATVVMAEPEGHRDPEYLVRAIREQGVTVVQFVPSQLRLVLAQGGLGECPALRRVFSGGEALPGALREAFFAASGAELVNLYGPTEVAIDATAERCVRGERLEGVTIGRPIANDRVYVLDGELEPVPAGVAGHLCVGGTGVSWGYRGKPGLTAERFVPDPLSGLAGGRLYRTGDRARHLPGGRLEYLGRMDEQVKVRGVRIELGEIEGLLRTAPGVGEAAAAVREGEDGALRLVAWVKATEPGALEVAAVREHLRRHLPEVMMPSAVVEVGEMPHLPNGKVDRGALPDPGDPTAGLHRAFVPPRTRSEELAGGGVERGSWGGPGQRARRLLRPRWRLDPQHPAACRGPPPRSRADGAGSLPAPHDPRPPRRP